MTDTDDFDFDNDDTATISATIDHDGGTVEVSDSDGSQGLGGDAFGEDGDKVAKIGFNIGSFDEFDYADPAFYVTIDIDSPTGLTLENITLEFPIISYGLIVSKAVTFDKSPGGQMSGAEGGEMRITFYELRGDRNPYDDTVSSRFIFRCWGSPEEDNRDLWVLLDDALHDQNNAMFGDMLVYFCLRAEEPETELEEELRAPGAFNTSSAYHMMYWEDL